jgi:hypothetical protein
MSMIKLKDLLSENNPPAEPDGVEMEVASNSHNVKTVDGQTFFVTNLRRDVILIEVKMTNGVAFVTIK